MNYLWEVIIQAKNEGIKEEDLRFCIPKVFSAYMELSNVFINKDDIGIEQYIEINPFYRFYKIFKNLYEPDYAQGEELRDSLFQLIIHQLARNDIFSGMTKEEYYKALLLKDIEDGKLGHLARRVIHLFNMEQQQLILSGILRLYQTKSSIQLFREIIKVLIPEHIIYHNNENTSEMLIYIGKKKNDILDQKLNFLIDMFLDLSGKIEVYYEHHFGIIGVEETMIINEIALY